jgi:NAD(P)-dependent dehydrogenase (short-subunit alcohol dehydrogenase family)
VEPTAFLSGKVALVTGSSRASGPPPRSCSPKRASTSSSTTATKTTCRESSRADPRPRLPGLARAGDLTDADQTRRMFDQIQVSFGRLDILVLNASGGLERNMPPEYAPCV